MPRAATQCTFDDTVGPPQKGHKSIRNHSYSSENFPSNPNENLGYDIQICSQLEALIQGTI